MLSSILTLVLFGFVVGLLVFAYREEKWATMSEKEREEAKYYEVPYVIYYGAMVIAGVIWIFLLPSNILLQLILVLVIWSLLHLCSRLGSYLGKMIYLAILHRELRSILGGLDRYDYNREFVECYSRIRETLRQLHLVFEDDQRGKLYHGLESEMNELEKLADKARSKRISTVAYTIPGLDSDHDRDPHSGKLTIDPE